MSNSRGDSTGVSGGILCSTLCRIEMDQVAIVRAREETTTRLATVEESLATQQAAWEKERATPIAERTIVVSQLGDAKRESDAKELDPRKNSRHDEESTKTLYASQIEFGRSDATGVRVAGTTKRD